VLTWTAGLGLRPGVCLECAPAACLAEELAAPVTLGYTNACLTQCPLAYVCVHACLHLPPALRNSPSPAAYPRPRGQRRQGKGSNDRPAPSQSGRKRVSCNREDAL